MTEQIAEPLSAEKLRETLADIFQDLGRARADADRLLTVAANRGIVIDFAGNLAAIPATPERQWEVDDLAAILHSESIGCEWVAVDVEGRTGMPGVQVSTECRGDHTTEAMAIIARLAAIPATPDVGLRVDVRLERMAPLHTTTDSGGNCTLPCPACRAGIPLFPKEPSHD